VNARDARAIAQALLDAYERGSALASFAPAYPDFDVAAAYDVLREVERRRIAMGWQPVGRKIGFTNRTLWPRYGVDRPMWAHVWRESVVQAPHGHASLSLAQAAEPRIEPEVVFGIGHPVSADVDAAAALRSVAWIAPGFEIVQSHFPGWKFTVADCTAAFGLHRSLVIGPRTAIDEGNRDALLARLPAFELTLRRGDAVVERGAGSNVLDGPAHALAFLSRVLHSQPAMPPLAAGEIVTTGTITDAWPVAPGETWSSDYGALGLTGIILHLT
jgi:2-oxo-3-hexenedioate decarboxylase